MLIKLSKLNILVYFWCMENNYIKSRGAQVNPTNRFIKKEVQKYYDDLPTHDEREDLALHNAKTKFIEVFPKTILNKVTSPDIGPAWSMNPYQGCEHGCTYCYARNSHEYWDYSAGMDFEQNILVKKSAPKLLREALKNQKWKADAIMLAGNTDCYQPAERKFGITRELLEVFWEFRHPVGVITKNSLIERDVDILQKLASENLVRVTLSLTTLDEDVKRILEPRTSSVRHVLRTIKELSNAGIGVNVNMAPIIPAINDHEIFELVRTVSEAGASSVNYTIVRLNGQLAQIFEDWIMKNMPDRANKVLNRIRAMHGGKLNDSQYGRRMGGEGEWAELIKRQFAMARLKFLQGKSLPKLNYDLYEQYRGGQMKLF